MTVFGWILVVIGALVNFLAKPVLNKIPDAGKDPDQKLLYIIKILGSCVVIVGAIMIFFAGGKING